MFIDETGWQVDTTGRAGYANNENVPAITEAKQAEDYEKLVHLANCEPTLTAFHFFHEIDESDRAGFQSGVLRATGETPLGGGGRGRDRPGPRRVPGQVRPGATERRCWRARGPGP